MKLIPKLLNGGFTSYYTKYKSVPIPDFLVKAKSTSSTSKSSSDDTKGKVTEKDLFTMLKDIDGLPNERKALFDLLQNIFEINNLTGRSIGDVSQLYLRSLYQLKTAIDNKKQYDAALKTAADNGAINEPAISPNGKLIVLGKNGELETVSLEEYTDDPELYASRILTVSNIANLRAYDSDFINRNDVFNIITNSVGFESFQKLIDQAKVGLGNSTYTRNGQFTAEGKASKGIEQLEKLKNDPRLSQIVGSVTLEGLYEYELIDSDQMQQIKASVDYMTAVLPDRAKTWAAFKVGTTNKNEATRKLVFQYLLGSQSTTSNVDINYKGSTSHATGEGSSSSSGGKEEDPKAGYWRQVLAGHGGEDISYNLLVGRGSLSIDGKYYGAVPGIESNCSLGDFLLKSGAAFLRTNTDNITFGNVLIASNSYDDIMVNTRSGAIVVTLPQKNGKVDFDVLDLYIEINKKMVNSGLKEGSQEYMIEFEKLLHDAGLDYLLNSNGLPNPSRFGNFLVLEGLTSDKARIVSRQGNLLNIDNVKSDYILNAGDDPELYRILEEGLSSKDRGDYKIDRNEWYDIPSYWGSYDKLYKGNIYIPISNNPTNGMNADGNDIKESTSYRNEEATLVWNKRKNQGSTGSNNLIQ